MIYNISKNLILSGITKLSNVFMLILLIVAGRTLGEHGFGELSIVFAFVYLFENLTDFGLSDITLKDVSRDLSKAGVYFSNLIVWKLLLCCIVFVLVLAVCQFISYSENIVSGIYIFMFSGFFRSLKNFTLAFYKTNNNYGLEALSVNIERALILTLGLLVLAFAPTVTNLLLVFLFVRLFDYVAVLFVLDRVIFKIHLTFDWPFIKTLQIHAVPVGLYIYVAFVYGYVDTLMLASMRSYAEVGWYNASYRIYDGLEILGFIVFNAILPPLSRYFHTNTKKHLLLSKKSCAFALILSFPLSYLLLQNGQFIITTVFGNSYEQSIQSFKILMAALFFTLVMAVLNCILISMDRLKVIFYLASIGLFVNIAANILLIPNYGHLGAAASTMISQFIVFTLTVIYLDRIYPDLHIKRDLFKVAMIALLVLTALGFIGQLNGSPLFNLTFFLLYILGGIIGFWKKVFIFG